MAPAKRSKRRKSLVRFTDEQRKELFALARQGWKEKPETGYSIRQLAAAVGVSKSTLSDWVLGPLGEELKAALKEQAPTRPVFRNRVAPATEEEPVADQGDQGTEIEEAPATRRYESETIRDYHPEWQFGGVISDRGRPDSPGVPGTDIRYSVNGMPLCARCNEPLPGSARDAMFSLDVDGKRRPCCSACKRKGETLYTWPAMPGEVLHVPSRKR
jgi:transposase-like protein